MLRPLRSVYISSSRLFAAGAIFLWLALCIPPMFAAEIVNLGQFFPSGINNSGQIAGIALGATGPYAAVYSAGHLTDLGNFPGFPDAFAATAINNAGQVTGLYSAPYQISGFLYSNGQMIDIGAFVTDAGADTYPYAINDSGSIVGSARAPGLYGPQHPFLYTGSHLIDLGTFGGTLGIAYGINDAGQVVGVATSGMELQHAFLYSGGKMNDLNSVLGAYSSGARAINNAGQIIGGFTSAPDGPPSAFLYTGGRVITLGNLPGFDDSGPIAINNVGQIVGYSYSATAYTYTSEAFLYQNGAMIDLTSLLPANSGWDLQSVAGINDFGQIIGTGFFDGVEANFLLDTTPEPATFGLLGAGAVFVGVARRKRFKHI